MGKYNDKYETRVSTSTVTENWETNPGNFIILPTSVSLKFLSNTFFKTREVDCHHQGWYQVSIPMAMAKLTCSQMKWLRCAVWRSVRRSQGLGIEPREGFCTQQIHFRFSFPPPLPPLRMTHGWDLSLSPISQGSPDKSTLVFFYKKIICVSIALNC